MVSKVSTVNLVFSLSLLSNLSGGHNERNQHKGFYIKKNLIPALLLMASAQVFAQSMTQVPAYFAVTDESMSPLADKTWKKVPVKDFQTDKAYLRGYFYADPFPLKTIGSLEGTPSSMIASKRKVRRAAVADLLKKGVLRSGDVVLSFRPLWENTATYPHVQMGVSHAGLIYIENGVAKNLDMPLDSHHNGDGYDSSLDAPHYLGGDTYHIVRPRGGSLEKQKNLLSWIAQIKKNVLAFRSRGQLKFNSDYNASKYNTYGAEDSFVTSMAKIILGQDTTNTSLTMFCSEFVWAMLSLSNCTPDQLALETSKDAVCVNPVMKPLPMLSQNGVPGLTEGPLAVLDHLDISVSEKIAYLDKIFTQGDLSRLSGGHRDLAKDPKVQQLMGVLKQMYAAKLAGQTIPGQAQIVSQINAMAPLNYSPTSFVINAMLDVTNPVRKFDYVATIIFK